MPVRWASWAAVTWRWRLVWSIRTDRPVAAAITPPSARARARARAMRWWDFRGSSTSPASRSMTAKEARLGSARHAVTPMTRMVTAAAVNPNGTVL